MAVSTELAPLFAWDSSDKSNAFHGWEHWREASLWADDHGLPSRNAYRIEFFRLDAPFARYFAYAHGEDGRVLANDRNDGPVKAPPADKILDELPPAHLRVTPWQ